jgi:hypothetical protein
MPGPLTEPHKIVIKRAGLHTRISQEHPRRAFDRSTPKTRDPSLQGGLWYMAFARSSCKDLFQRCHQDLQQIFSQGLLQDLDHKSFIRRHLRESRRIIIEGPAIERILPDLCKRTSSKHLTRAFIQAPLTQVIGNDFVEECARIFTSSSHQDLCKSCKDIVEDFTNQDLHKIVSPRPVQDYALSSQYLLTRTSTKPWSTYS